MTIKRHQLLLLLLISLSSCLFCIRSHGQQCNDHELDSVRRLASKAGIKPPDKIDCLNQIARCLLDIDQDSATWYALLAADLSNEIGYKKGMAVSQLRLGKIQEKRQNFDDALRLYQMTIHLYGQIGKDEEYLSALNYAGIIYEMRHDYDQALEYYLLGLAEAESIDNKLYRAFFHNNASFIYKHIGNRELELKNYKKAASLFQELGQDYYYSYSLVNIGSYYVNAEAYDSAKIYLRAAEGLMQSDSNYYGLANLYINLGELLFQQDKLHDALDKFNKSLDYARLIDSGSLDRKNRIAVAHLLLGNTYLKMENYTSAIQNFRISYTLAKRYRALMELQEVCFGLFNSFLNLSQQDSALHYLELYHAYNDSLQRELYNEKIDQLDYEFKLENERTSMAKEKAILLAEKRRDQLLYTIVTIILLLLATGGILIGYLQKMKLQKSELIKSNLQLEKESMASNLEKKNRELTTNVLYLLKKNEYITVITHKLRDLSEGVDRQQKKIIIDLVREMENSILRDAWSEFELRFNDVHQEFYRKLNEKHPGLSPNELRLSAFLRLNMSSKEIASISFQSVQSLKVARYRLRRKLNLSRGENLVTYLSQL